MSKQLYLFFLYYVVIEGALRKWFFPSVSTELFLLKDVLLYLSLFWYLAFDTSRFAAQGAAFLPGERATFVTWILIVLMAFAITGLSLASLSGLRFYLAALPILMMHPRAFSDLETLQDFYSRFVFVAFLVCCLGFVQFVSPPDSPINAYAWSGSSSSDVATFGELEESDVTRRFSYVRITGTFSYISTYAAYLQFIFFVSLGLVVLARTERFRLLYSGISAVVLLNILMSGSRAALAFSLVLALPFYRPMLSAVLRRYGALLGIALGFLIGGAVLFSLWDVFSALEDRNERAGDASERVLGTALMPITTIANWTAFGEGLGESFLGIGEATGGQVHREYNFDEVTQDRIGVEIGVPCYLFFLSFKIYFLFASLSLYLRSRTAQVQVWALVSFAYQASLMWQIPIYNSVANIFFFVSIATFAMARRANVVAGRRSGAVHSNQEHGLSLQVTR